MLKQKWGCERVTVNYRNLGNWKKIKILCWVKFGSRCPSGSRQARIKAQDMYFFGLFSHNLAVNRSIYFGFMAIYTLIWPKLADFSENEILPHRDGWEVQIGIIFIDTRHREPKKEFMTVVLYVYGPHTENAYPFSKPSQMASGHHHHCVSIPYASEISDMVCGDLFGQIWRIWHLSFLSLTVTHTSESLVCHL